MRHLEPCFLSLLRVNCLLVTETVQDRSQGVARWTASEERTSTRRQWRQRLGMLAQNADVDADVKSRDPRRLRRQENHKIRRATS